MVFDKAKQAAEKAKNAADKAKELSERPQARLQEKQQAKWEAKGVLFEGISHDEGRNAKVTLYPDRVERVKERSAISMSRAAQDAEVTPIRQITSVQAKKKGFRTNVTVYAAGNNIEFRFSHDEATRFRVALQELILKADAPTPAAPAAPDVADQLRKLGELRDAGVLTQEEFDAKKTDLLSRM